MGGSRNRYLPERDIITLNTKPKAKSAIYSKNFKLEKGECNQEQNQRLTPEIIH